ncbi:ATP-citrate synthase [Nitzschia inconspicua]|uniref:ATP-citrate synthase n=1 Tax=Nitzschia inconspicua TaxID=303405 RepID=A0A9K3LJE6_9STRA|nr:ATP-citrate synthase [Nitzschia inconspicua]
MSAKAVREHHGKKLLARHVKEVSGGRHVVDDRSVLITPTTDFNEIALQEPWLLETQLVVKPDQLIKRRGKAGLVGIKLDWAQVQAWIGERMQTEIQVDSVEGELHTFIVEPFVPHESTDEYYICIQSDREGEEILFYSQGGVDVGDVDSKAKRLHINIQNDLSVTEIETAALLEGVPPERLESLASFVITLFQVYRMLNFTYMEINPIVFSRNADDGQEIIVPLDLAAKIDETAAFLNSSQWGHLDFPAPFGRKEFPEEAHIRELDAKTGASLKLTILNPQGRIWTMVAGGGASVVYADTISDLGFAHELANYGEYSGAPSMEHTYEYAKTLIGLMTKESNKEGKIFIIGGSIANFTDVAATFAGLIKAIKAYSDVLKQHNVKIWIRRAGPNYQEGLQMMRECSNLTGLDIKIYGPETHITAVVPLALGLEDPDDFPEFDDEAHVKKPATASKSSAGMPMKKLPSFHRQIADHEADHKVENFTAMTRCVVYGLMPQAVQGMLDFDFMCKRETPSVAAMIFPFSSNHYMKFYWGTDEILLPVYQSMEEAFRKHPEVSVVVNFASFRSVYDSVMEMLENYSEQIKTIAIIAEGVPESQTRKFNKVAMDKGVGIIGPATVGGIKPGCFRIGNTGGMLDNIVMCKLYRPGSVAYVSRSGGLSNELNNMISRNSDGVYEGVAIGGDRYPGSRFLDHLLRYNDNPSVHMLVLLGEVGGVDEYEICDALKSGRISKPLVAWCIGTCASKFSFEVQFGHAGALAKADMETSLAKNKALKEAGALVPDNFFEFGNVIKKTYDDLVAAGTLVPAPEVEAPKIPMDYQWAKRLGLVRKPAAFISSISDDRGDELKYSGMPISEVFEKDLGVGGVLGLLWFRRQLPPYVTKFIEMILMVTADHGPAVAGAHNSIVAARAGKDLVSSLASGLLTIGPRFGGALDDAAKMFTAASDAGEDAEEFVKSMRKQNKLIMGIGHRIKSLANPDKRVEIIKRYALENFSDNTILNFALAVEQFTTKKKANLILNVDGCIAVCFVDMLRSCGAFTKQEADEMIENGCLNGLFVLGRSIGFIGHFLDQKRLKQGLYRHPWDDISYLTEYER